MRRNYRRRLDRLERQRRDAGPLTANLLTLPCSNDPKAAALRAELNAITRQIRARLTPTGDAAADHTALRQALLQDDRACEVACQLVEVEAGMVVLSGEDDPPESRPA
jgi:hypothetical protein